MHIENIISYITSSTQAHVSSVVTRCHRNVASAKTWEFLSYDGTYRGTHRTPSQQPKTTAGRDDGTQPLLAERHIRSRGWHVHHAKAVPRRLVTTPNTAVEDFPPGSRWACKLSLQKPNRLKQLRHRVPSVHGYASTCQRPLDLRLWYDMRGKWIRALHHVMVVCVYEVRLRCMIWGGFASSIGY